MFSSLSRFVIDRPWVVIVAWLVLTAGLHHLAPRWEQVTKDDDVRFFPPDSLSVIGHDLLERGFPADASSSQLVLVYERKHGRVTPDDLRYIEDVATKLYEFGRSQPELGIKKAGPAQHAGHRSAADWYKRRRSGPGGADDREVGRDSRLQEDSRSRSTAFSNG